MRAFGLIAVVGLLLFAAPPALAAVDTIEPPGFSYKTPPLENSDTTLVPLRGSLRATSDQAAQTLGQAEATLASFQAVIEPGSPFVQQFETALADLAAAGHALRRLAEYLEQNPSALLRGKPAPEEPK